MSVRLNGIIAAGVLSIAASVITVFEGKSLVAYLDPVGIPTICSGIIANVRLNDVATQAECNTALDREMRSHLLRIETCIHGYLTPNQWAAILSWSYNIGTGAACNSTLVRKINAGLSPTQWCSELSRWTMAGGKYYEGLARRRKSERQLCESDIVRMASE